MQLSHTALPASPLAPHPTTITGILVPAASKRVLDAAGDLEDAPELVQAVVTKGAVGAAHAGRIARARACRLLAGPGTDWPSASPPLQL